jgi:predicted MarR family transcription regulator
MEERTRTQAEAMTQFELSLIVANNAFQQWVLRCGAASGVGGFSALDLLVLHMVNSRGREKRAANICFALKIEDAHTVSYSLKKLSKAGLVQSDRSGKETLYSCTEAGAAVCSRYAAVRRQCLIQSLSLLSDSDLDINVLADLLRALSGIYEQASRHAETTL